MSSQKSNNNPESKNEGQKVSERGRDVDSGIFHRLLQEGWIPNWAVSTALLLMAPLVGIFLAGTYGAILGFLAGLLILLLVFINAVRRERESQEGRLTPEQYSQILEDVARRNQAKLTAGMTPKKSPVSRHISRDAQLQIVAACASAYDKAAIYLGVYDEEDQEARSFEQEIMRSLLLAGCTVNRLDKNPTLSYANIVDVEIQVNPVSFAAKSRWLPTFLITLGEIGMKFHQNITDLGPHGQAITIIVGKSV